MYCKVCRDFPNLADKNSSSFSGSKSFHVSNIKGHDQSSRHAKCVETQKAREALKSTPIRLGLRNLNAMTEEKLVKLFNTLQLTATGLDISARPLTQASVKSVGRVQITDHSPVSRVRFFIAKKLIKLQNKRCFLYSVLPRNL